MTLGFGSNQKFILETFLRTTTLVALILVLPVAAMGHSVSSLEVSGDQWFIETGCLFFNESLSEHEMVSESPKTAEPEVDYDVFPLENAIHQVAQKITRGIVMASGSSQDSVNPFAESMVDLGILVGNSVEATTLQNDPYWNYYLSCDRWDVVFNSQPEFHRSQPVATSLPTEQPAEKNPRVHFINSLRHLYLSMEFFFIENLHVQPLQPILEPEKKPSYFSVAKVLGIDDFGSFGIWNSLSKRVEMASQLLFRLRVAARIGDQLLESSRQSVHH